MRKTRHQSPSRVSQDGSRPRGRPRIIESDSTVLNSTYALLAKKGFSGFSIDDVVDQTGIAKTTIYRRWPSKAALALASVQSKISPYLGFPAEGDFEDRLLSQMRQLAELFQGDEGRIISSLVGAAQDDRELADALKEEYLGPRRKIAREFFQAWPRFKNFSLREIESLIDVLYGGLYFRLLLKHSPISIDELEPWLRKVMQENKK